MHVSRAPDLLDASHACMQVQHGSQARLMRDSAPPWHWVQHIHYDGCAAEQLLNPSVCRTGCCHLVAWLDAAQAAAPSSNHHVCASIKCAEGAAMDWRTAMVSTAQPMQQAVLCLATPFLGIVYGAVWITGAAAAKACSTSSTIQAHMVPAW